MLLLVVEWVPLLALAPQGPQKAKTTARRGIECTGLPEARESIQFTGVLQYAVSTRRMSTGRGGCLGYRQ